MLTQEIVELGPIHPHHLVEARRRLLSRGELVSEKPKPMFKRRWFIQNNSIRYWYCSIATFNDDDNDLLIWLIKALIIN